MKYNICFVLGYQAEDKTEIHRKLVDLFALAGWSVVIRKAVYWTSMLKLIMVFCI